jgi:hypothetical protein
MSVRPRLLAGRPVCAARSGGDAVWSRRERRSTAATTAADGTGDCADHPDQYRQACSAQQSCLAAAAYGRLTRRSRAMGSRRSGPVAIGRVFLCRNLRSTPRDPRQTPWSGPIPELRAFGISGSGEPPRARSVPDHALTLASASPMSASSAAAMA